jgi:hypothetical protein
MQIEATATPEVGREIIIDGETRTITCVELVAGSYVNDGEFETQKYKIELEPKLTYAQYVAWHGPESTILPCGWYLWEGRENGIKWTRCYRRNADNTLDVMPENLQP